MSEESYALVMSLCWDATRCYTTVCSTTSLFDTLHELINTADYQQICRIS